MILGAETLAGTKISNALAASHLLKYGIDFIVLQ